jgi:DNA polymerase-3 subunit alpha
MENFSIQSYTVYSKLYGTSLPKEWIKRAAKLGHRALGFTDRTTMSGLVKLEKLCREVGIKPIHGYDTYLYKDNSKDDSNKCLGRVLLYAKTAKGFQSLIQANNKSLRKIDDGGNFYYRPRLTIDNLIELEDIIVVIPEQGGDKMFEAASKPKSDLYQTLMQLSRLTDLYLGVSSSPVEGFRCIPAYDTRAIEASHLDACEALSEMDNGYTKINICNGETPYSLEQINDDVDPSLLQNLNTFFDSIQSNILEIGVYKLPPNLVDDPRKALLDEILVNWKKKLDPDYAGETIEELASSERLKTTYPDHLIKKKSSKAYAIPLSEYAKQLIHEVQLKDSKNFHPYFHPIYYVNSILDKEGFERGPGRGSAAGSLYMYLTNITMVDPKENSLIYQRFLTSSRKDYPDVDSDYSRSGRDRVMEILFESYGHDRVTKIGTYNRLKIKSCIKDLARSLGYGIKDNDGNIVQYEPFVLNRILDLHVTATSRGLVELAELRTYAQFEEFYQKHSNWFDKYVMPLLETIKSESIHAAGVVITQTPFIDLLPLNFRNDNEGQTTQWEMDDLDTAGYLKYDMLVIDALDVIADAKRLIKERHGFDIPSIDEVSTEDELALKLFESVLTRGIFQYNTWSQMNYFRILKPKTFDDLVAAVALIRPGPMAADAHNLYAQIANGLTEAKYMFEALIPILGNTHGLMIYQEQMMRIAVAIADFSEEDSEALRKACGKKKREEMDKWQVRFIEQAVAKGHARNKVEELWSQVVEFAEYSFNKCLTGDTVVLRGGKNRFCDKIEMTIDELYNASLSNTSWGAKIRQGRQKIRMMNSDGRVRLGNIKGIYENGVRSVFKVTLDNGMSIKATSNHRLLTSSGYKEISQLSDSDFLIVQGEKEAPKSQYIDRSTESGYHKGKAWNFNETLDRTGEANPAYIDGRTKMLKDARQACIARADGHCELCNIEETEGSRFEVAHIKTFEQCNGNYELFHNADNTQYICNSCHKKLDYQKGERSKAWSVGIPTAASKIISIESAGEEMTYDIEMVDEDHNFIANGIVSHNSHSVAYSMVSFYQAYIKARFPTEYWCATLSRAKKSSNSGNSVYDLKSEAELEGIEFVFPSADGFAAEFQIADDMRIYWPLSVIKGVGENALNHLTDSDNRFHFDNMQNFVDVCLLKKSSIDKNGKKTSRLVVNSGVVKAMIKAGFFNCWMKPKDAMKEYNRLKAIATSTKEEALDYEMESDSIFYWQNLRNEAYGCQVDSWKKVAAFDPECRSYYAQELADMPDGTALLIGGQVKEMILKRTKQGRSFAQFLIVDGAESYSIKAWSDFWEDENLDKNRTRPRNGDLVELLVEKKTWNSRPEFHIGRKCQYCRIVGRN